jgi:carboxypeptidase Taq
LKSTQTGFCWGSNKDITLSIETYEDKLYLGLGNTWHETGHLLYLLNMSTLPEQAQGRPVGQFNGFGAHETAAMFMEQAGLRLKGMEMIEPIIRDELAKAKAAVELPNEFDINDPGLSAANLHAQANRPKLDDMEWGTSELALPPNMAWRVLALRKLIDNEMTVDELPQFWADSMKEWTGMPHDPKDFRVGESHIFEGLGGYFYAYMTGAFNAAEMQRQIAPAAVAADAAMPAGTALRDYVKLYADTLKTRLFDQASMRPAMDTLRHAINGGDPNDPSAYMARVSAAARDGMPAPDMVATDIVAETKKSKPGLSTNPASRNPL